MSNSWYSKKIVVLFVFLSISLIFVFSGKNVKLGNAQNSKYAVFSIRFEYFGMDAENIERIISIPLEEKLSCMSNLLEIRTTAEYGKSVTTVYFDKKINTRNTYLEIRDYVDTLYNTLPSSVQKPRIFSSDVNDNSVITIAINGEADLEILRAYIDEHIKPKIESVDGVSEVIVAGGNVNEILIEYDNEQVINNKINPNGFGAIIQDANVVSPAGKIRETYQQQAVVFDTKLNDINEVKKLPVKLQEGYTSLEYLANVSISPREKDEIVRINGKECISLQVYSAFSGNNISISREVKKIISNSELGKDNYKIIQDNGQESFEIIMNVIIALFESFVFIIFLIPFFYKSLRIVFLLFVIIPINVIWTIAQLYILDFPIDQNILSGITIALGLIADSSLIITETGEKSSSFLTFEKKVKELFFSVIASSFTTVLALIPLFFLDSMVPGIKSIAISIALMLLNSTVISILFLPAFIYSSKEYKNQLSKKILRTSYRNCYRISCWNDKNSRILKVIYVIFCLAPLFMFFYLEKNVSLENQSKIIFAQVEYETDKKMESIDEEIFEIISVIEAIDGVQFVMTDSKKGNCEIEIGYDENEIDRYVLTNRIADLEVLLSEGFLYIPERGIKNATESHEIEITIFGDDSKKCRDYATEIVDYASKSPFVAQAVLNFKEPEQEIKIKPDIELLAKSGSSVQDVASQLRWSLFGPVVDKWIQQGKEMDIRIVGKNAKTTNLSQLENTYVILGSDSTRLNNIGNFIKEKSICKIYRNNNRRCAYCTFTVRASSSEKAMNISREIINNVSFEKGYGYHFSRDLELLNEQYRILFFVFFACVVLIVIFLTSITESIKKTIIIISIIPASLFIPLLYKVIGSIPLEMGDIVGMILVSGISVNNSIYIMESRKDKIRYKVRDKFRSIIVTSLSTIIGAIPLIIRNTGSFASALSLFMLLGVLSSLIISIFIFPAMVKKKLDVTSKRT